MVARTFLIDDWFVTTAEQQLRTAGFVVPAAIIAELMSSAAEASVKRIGLLQAEVDRLTALLNTPLLEPFAQAVVAEAQHQVYRHGFDHDARKDAYAWLWLLGYLVGKAARAANDGDHDKALHHTITAGAALANWHRQILERREAA